MAWDDFLGGEVSAGSCQHACKVVGTTRDPVQLVRGEFEESSRRVRGEFEESSRRVRGEFEESSRRVRGEFEESSRRVRGEFEESCVQQICNNHPFQVGEQK